MSTLSPLRKLILAVGGLASLGVIACAVLSLVDWMGRTSYERDDVLATEGQRLVVHNTGDISVSPSTDGLVHVHVRVRYGLHKPLLVLESTPDGVTLEARCHDWVGINSCSVQYSVTVPERFTVEVVASHGAVSATGLSGDVSLTTRAGDVQATRMTGTLRLRSSAGDVRASELRSATVTARTSAGSVSLTFAEPPRNVTAQTSAGDVHVTVPALAHYLIIATSSAGDESVDSRLQSPSPDPDHRITATSSAGDVSVLATPG